MRRKVFTLLVAAAGMVGVASLALASHDEPSQAKKFQSTWITAYPACTAPDTTTGTGLPACSNQAPNDAVCKMGGTGKGKVKAGVTGSGLTLSYKLKSLVCPDGTVLQFVASVNATTDDCSTPPCTVLGVATTDFNPGAPCTVAAGACAGSVTVPAAVIMPGNHTGISLKGVALKNGSVHSFEAGILIP